MDTFVFWFCTVTVIMGAAGIFIAFRKRDMFAMAGWWLGTFGYAALALHHLEALH